VVHGSRAWFTMDSVHPLSSPHGSCAPLIQRLLPISPAFYAAAPWVATSGHSRVMAAHGQTLYNSTGSQGHKGLNGEQVAVD
jgi:hypothetical protein